MNVTNTPEAPKAIGPYSQAISSGGLLFSSGQIPLDPATGDVVGGNITEQAEQVLKNVAAILKANGIGAENIVKTLCFLVDMQDFAAFNKVYEGFMGDHKPARSCVAVRELPKGVLCEIEVIAELGRS